MESNGANNEAKHSIPPIMASNIGELISNIVVYKMSVSNRCAYIRRDQTPCPTRVRGDSRFCYKHRNSYGAKVDHETLPVESKGNIKNEKKKSNKDVIEKIVSDTLGYDGDSDDETLSEVPKNQQKQAKINVDEVLLSSFIKKKKKDIIAKNEVDLNSLDNEGLLDELERQMKRKPLNAVRFKDIVLMLHEREAINDSEMKELLREYIK